MNACVLITFCLHLLFISFILIDIWLTICRCLFHVIYCLFACLFQIAPAAKKLWGLEGGKDAGKLALHPLNHEQVWRDPTWSTPGQ